MDLVQWRHRGCLVLGLALASASCATLAPHPTRFVTVYEERSGTCRIQIVRDTRTDACYVAFQCNRWPVMVLPGNNDECVP